MPTTPEFGDVTTEIGHVEVSHQLDTEQFRRTDGDIRVSGKISVNLEGKQDCRQEQGASGLGLIRGENLIHIDRTVVRNHHLLEQSPQDLAHSINTGLILECPRLRELREQIRRTLNGASNKLRKETHIGEELNHVLCGPNLAPVHIDAVTECLESIETDPDRENDMQQKALRPSAQEYVRKRCYEKVIILEHPKDQQIHDDIQHVDRLRLAWFFTESIYQQAADITAQRRKCDQKQEPPVPPAVKHIRSDHHEQILQLQVLAEHEPVQQKYHRQKYCEFQRVEQHQTIYLFSIGICLTVQVIANPRQKTTPTLMMLNGIGQGTNL